jgi:hypothetical protein
LREITALPERDARAGLELVNDETIGLPYDNNIACGILRRHPQRDVVACKSNASCAAEIQIVRPLGILRARKKTEKGKYNESERQKSSCRTQQLKTRGSHDTKN